MLNQRTLSKLQPMLTCFEISAREASFSAAALALQVTPAAISQSITKLERSVGHRLFDRTRGGVLLTEFGTALLHAANASSQAFEREWLKIRHTAHRVTITAPPTLATCWLMPRIAQLQRLSGANIVIQAAREIANLDLGDADLAIRYAERGALHDHHRRVSLFKQRFVPVCAPDVVAKKLRFESLSETTLIHEQDQSRWRDWLVSAGRTTYAADEIVAKAKSLVVEHGWMASEAARYGAGVALAEPTFVGEFLARGQLVTPFSHAWTTGRAHTLVWSGRFSLGSAALKLKQAIKAAAGEIS